MVRPALEVIDGGKCAGRVWLKELYTKFAGAVFGRCQYLLKDSAKAEDAMQDVFARAIVHERRPSSLHVIERLVRTLHATSSS